MEPVNHIKIKNTLSVNELVKQMDSAGVLGSGRLGKAVNICEAMIKDKDCRVFLGLAGPLVPGGMKDIIIDIIENKWVDVVVTTGATLTHDLGEALGYRHYQGSADADDAELHKLGFDRIYDSYMPNQIYEGMEGCKSNVNCDALLLDEASATDTYPYIEIEDPTAAIEHEATVSKLSDEQIFYLQQRGVPEEEARNMIINGFIEPFTKLLPLEYAVEMNRLIELQMEGSVG